MFFRSQQSWMPSLLSGVASVLELITDSSRCVVAMSFSRLCSLSVSISRRHIEGRVFSRSSFSEHLWSLFFFFLSQGMRCGFLRRPHSIFMCHCFHCCSSRNEQRDEKCFCSDSLALCVWQTMFVSGKFARQMVVITVVMSSKHIMCVIVWSALARIFRGLALFHGRGKVACVLRMFLGWLHRSSSLCIPLTADDECSRDVLRVAKSDGCCVCRCVLE